jgi:hypothetical protein
LVKEAPSDLPTVVREIVEALLAGDWTRYSEESGRHFYYIIREQDHNLEVNHRCSFGHMLTFGKYEPDAFEDWYMRSALAEEPPDRLAKARKRVAAAGIDPKFFDAVIEACRSAQSPGDLGRVFEDWMPRFVDSRFEALNAVLEGLRIDRVRRKEIFVSESDRPEIRAALEGRFLKELSERFPKVVDRATGLDWLSFSDPQVREACRCYLYGFFRATVLVAAAGLEARLKKVGCVEVVSTYDALVDSVFGLAGACGADAARSSALKEVFRFRNRIAHDGAEPQRDEAAQVLDVVRDTLEALTELMDEGV